MCEADEKEKASIDPASCSNRTALADSHLGAGNPLEENAHDFVRQSVCVVLPR